MELASYIVAALFLSYELENEVKLKGRIVKKVWC